MSHANVTVTRTVTTSSPNAIFLNTGYLKTAPGILKILQLILSGVIIFMIFNKYDFDGRQFHYLYWVPILFMLLMATTFFICTFCLLISCGFSLSTSGLISKTLYEFVYHLIAAILLFIASVMLYIKIRDVHRFTYTDWYLTVSILCFINFVLYLASTVLAFREYKY